MYHAQVHISYFQDDAILQCVRRLSPYHRFTYILQEYTQLNDFIMRISDILIVKYSEFSFEEYKKYRKSRSRLILCIQPEKIPSLSEEFCANFEDIWPLPLSSSFVSYRLKQILFYMKELKDKSLHEQYLDTLIDSMPDMVWFKDNAGIHLKVNQSFCHTVGKTRDDITGKDHCYIWNVPRDEFEKGVFVCNETEDLVRKLKKTCRFDEKVKSKGELRQFHTYKSPIFDDDNRVIGTVGIGHDITDLQNMSTELEIVLRSMPFAILVKNDKNKIINVNDKFIEYFHISKEMLINTQYDEWKKQTLKNTIEHDNYFECIINKGDNELILEYHEEPIFDIFKTNVGQLCIFRDITIETNLEKQILQNSNTDFLTGLYNRRYLYEYMNHYQHVKNLCLLYVDLDKFKDINDTYGHQVGDMALLEAALTLKECFQNDFTARIGGDEFLVIIMRELSHNDIIASVTSFIQSFETTDISGISKNLLSASVGITTYRGDHMNLDQLIKQADAALYQAKQKGKGSYSFFIE